MFAVLLSKPNVSTCLHDFHRTLDERLRTLGIEVLVHRPIEYTKAGLALHYLPHSLFAFEAAAKHRQYFNSKSINLLEQRIGGTFEALVANRRYVSAAEAIEHFQLSPRSLYQAWESAGDEPLVQLGCHIKEIQLDQRDSFFVANAYFPYRFSLMDGSEGQSFAWLLSYPPDVSLRRGRRELLGDIGGDPQTLRGHLSSLARTRNLHVDKFNNGFHLSDSLGASVREAFIWFSTDDLLCISESLSLIGIKLQDPFVGRILQSIDYALRCSEIDEMNELRSTLIEVITSAN